jgi:hypothetical protein
MNKPLTQEEWLTYLDTTWKKSLSDAWQKEWNDMEDIIAMAREAGFADGVAEIVGLEGFARFAALVRVHEHKRLLAMMKQMHDAYALSSYPQGFKPKAKGEK